MIAVVVAQRDHVSAEGATPPMSATLNRETVNDTVKRLIARTLARDPSLVGRARATLDKMADRFPDQTFVAEWDAVLRRPVDEIVAVLVDRGQVARRLRLSSPFVLAEGIDFTQEALRRRIGQAAKRLAMRGGAVAEISTARRAVDRARQNHSVILMRRPDEPAVST
jgi:hypothetical protein